MTIDDLVRVLSTRRWRVNSEGELQDAVAKVLEDEPGFAGHVEREVTLLHAVTKKPVGRIDFRINFPNAFTIGLELKVDGARAAVMRQCQGYLSSGGIDDLVIASTRSTLLSAWPKTLADKTVRTVHLRGWP